ncbi:reverse transcriptase domain-containing protein [Tanacetum coccineum]
MDRALVNVHGEELTFRVGDKKLVFNIESTSKYPRKHGDESIHMIDILDTTCEDYFHEVLNVQKSIHPLSGSPTPSSDPVVEPLSPSLTPFRDSDLLLEETGAFVSLDDSIPPSIDNAIYDSEGDILFLEELLNDDPTPDLPHPLPVFEINETEKIKTSIENPPNLDLKDLPPHLELGENHLHLPLWNICLPKDAFRSLQCSWDFPKVHGGYLHDMIEKTMEVFMDDILVFMDSFSSCLFHLDMMLKSGIEVDRAKVDVISKLPPPTMVKGIRSVLGHAGFYRRFLQDFSKIARPMTHLLEKDTPFFFSSECQSSFEILKKQLTKAPILVSPDWDLPFEIMCDASDFAVGA